MAFSYSKIYSIKTIGLRFFTVYGPYGRPDMSPFLFANALQKKLPISIFNNGLMERDFTYIDDIVKYITGIVNTNIIENFSIYNLGNGNPVSLFKFIELLELEFGKKAERNYLPMQKGDVTKTWASTSKIENLLGQFPKTSIEDGIRKFANWYKEFNK